MEDLVSNSCSKQKDSNWKFMNYGFVDSNELKLEKEDEPDRESIQLYNYVATRVDVKIKLFSRLALVVEVVQIMLLDIYSQSKLLELISRQTL